MRKCVIESDFTGEICAEAIGLFECQFELIVQAFDNPAGILFAGDEVVEQESAVFDEAFGDSLERSEAAAGHPLAPSFQELICPRW